LHKVKQISAEVDFLKRARTITQSILSARDFPGEILTGVPVIEMKGVSEAVILSHRGVIAYDSDSVCIATAIGPVKIQGKELCIFRMNRERIVLHGTIRCIWAGESA
jgi:sporulation protein YqfC